ncbi:hypothetical protein ROZALSC1DRAFT_27918 [Rozella allomycis CSF55]|uniref:Uncharacterized protein n=1 Tax=Rozella allomycis (strain CSF55) TaxID=988480 RepID=A0A075AW96_ROZAC|nr:hypothetical protein O9G_000619 [Rozella allomycis CSF55]RKP20623.1 hypothetical protein ROZALSC1DRAFT_27918 [Rozella allomycis CSF55]|eukprot:EPZ34432.1 hypothetical protein O9G_000619 [Rozella allomycis CSF55]
MANYFKDNRTTIGIKQNLAGNDIIREQLQIPSFFGEERKQIPKAVHSNEITDPKIGEFNKTVARDKEKDHKNIYSEEEIERRNDLLKTLQSQMAHKNKKKMFEEQDRLQKVEPRPTVNQMMAYHAELDQQVQNKIAIVNSNSEVINEELTYFKFGAVGSGAPILDSSGNLKAKLIHQVEETPELEMKRRLNVIENSEDYKASLDKQQKFLLEKKGVNLEKPNYLNVKPLETENRNAHHTTDIILKAPLEAFKGIHNRNTSVTSTL